jgi:hypothetical protein
MKLFDFMDFNFKKRARSKRLFFNRMQLQELEKQGIPYNRTWKFCEEILSRMRIDDFKLLTPDIAMQHSVLVPFRSLQTYHVVLHQIRLALENEEKLERSWNSFETQTVSVADFMTTEDGFYMTADQMIAFLKTGVTVCELMNQADGEETGVAAYNHRALVHFFVRYKDTLMSLFELQAAL